MKNRLPVSASNRLLPPLRNITRLSLLCGSFLAASLTAAKSPNPPATVVVTPKPFVFTTADGSQSAAPMVDSSEKRKLTPATVAKIEALNPALAKAATIAQERANAHSKRSCWRYVKEALLAAGAVDSYPKTALAKQAGDELVRDYGFTKTSLTDPYKAPVGAVLVYDARKAPGHVEIRTKDGFVSDFKTPSASKRKLIGIYTKA
ncbi:MAG: hypothetical protein M3Y69_09135 [Verrucomicrobiota bacterium]|nr:hypothetical protein [Verrucomicrobiota bacterium]